MGKITFREWNFRLGMSITEKNLGLRSPVHTVFKIITPNSKSVTAVRNPAHFFYWPILQSTIFSAYYRGTYTERV